MPELLARSLREPTLPAHIYRHVLDFLASRPTPEQVASFGPTPEMTDRLRTLLQREGKGEIMPAEKAELRAATSGTGRGSSGVTHVPATLRRQVVERAGDRCEYCLLPAEVAFFPHEVEHVTAEKHGGTTDILSLRVSEVCSLRASSVRWSHGRWTLRCKVKGGRRSGRCPRT